MVGGLFAAMMFIGLACVLISAIAVEDNEINASIDLGIDWLIGQQEESGSWGIEYPLGTTGLTIVKLEDFAVELGNKNPFESKYGKNIQDGLNYTFLRARMMDLDGDGNNDSVFFNQDPNDGHTVYQTSIAVMAIAGSMSPDRLVPQLGSEVDGMIYQDVVELSLNYLIYAQAHWQTNDNGGWSYGHLRIDGNDDNSNTGYAVLGLDYANKKFCMDIPEEVKLNLSRWIDFIQCNSTGGAGYYISCGPYQGILETGNLLYEMAFVGDDATKERVKRALIFIQENWNNESWEPGWKGPGVPYHQECDWANYQATYTAMKGLESLKIEKINVGGNDSDWFKDEDYGVASAIVKQQQPNGSWNETYLAWYDTADRNLSTVWALLALERVIPRENSISVKKTADSVEGCPCTNITFTINVTNTGENMLNPARVVDLLPAGMDYVEALPAPDSYMLNNDETTTLIWENIGPLDPKASKLIVLVAHVDSGPSGTLVDKINVSGIAETPCPKAITAENETKIAVFNPNIYINKTANATGGCPGNDILFTINATNTGDYPLDEVRVEDLLQTGMTYRSSVPPYTNKTDNSNGSTTLIWDDLGPLGPQDTIVIKVTAHIENGPGPLADNVSATGIPRAPCAGFVTNKSKTFINVYDPKIDVEKVALPSDGRPSEIIRFKITVTNMGNYPLNPIRVVDTLPAGMTYIRDDSGGLQVAGTISWTFGPLNPGDAKIILLYASIDCSIKAEILTNSVAVSGDSLCGPRNDTDDANVTILPPLPRPSVPDANFGLVEVGNDEAVAYGHMAAATNNLEIEKNQDTQCSCCNLSCRDGCLVNNLEKIKAQSRNAFAAGSASASNNVKIIANQQ